VNFRTLKVLTSIADYRSFSRAAADCGLTQSAVSQIVQQVEEQLGVQLIDRSRRPLEMTGAGRIFCDGVRPLLNDYQRLEDEVRSLGQRASTQVTVAAIYSVGLSYMPEVTANFRIQRPDVAVQVNYLRPDEVYDAVAEGGADFGLISYARSTRAVSATPWREEPMGLFCAADHALASQAEVKLADLDRLPMIGFDHSLRIRHEIDSFLGRRMVRPIFMMEFDNIDSLTRAMQVNSGIGILPEPAVRRELAARTLKQIPCPELQLVRPLGVIWRRGIKLGTAAKELASMILGSPLEPPEPKRRAPKREVPQSIP
jgi:DNA-binding transcriptional LysR family regulator